MAFSATEAAFEGFRLVRRNPMALVAWALLYAALNLVGLFVMSNAMGRMLAWAEQMEAMEASPPTSPEQWTPIIQSYFEAVGSFIWLAPLSIVVTAMLTAAIARAVLNPRAKGFGYLRLGMDELRVFVVTLVLTILIGAVFVAVGILCGILMGVAAAMDAPWMWLVIVAVFLGGIGMAIWLSVRLSLAVPITVAENKFAFFDSFGLTKGRFWPLLGMAIIAGVMAVIVMLLATIVTMPLGLSMGSDIWTMGGHADVESMRAAFDVANPMVIVMTLVDAIVSALTVGVLYAPFAAAYRDIKGLGAETPTA